MADSQNPYQAPTSDLAVGPGGMGVDAYTPAMVRALKETKPWVRFLSILGFVGCGLMFLAGLVAVIVGFFAGEHEQSQGMVALIGVAYLVMGGIWVLPLMHLHKYANAITQVTQGAGAPAIEGALERQRSFWRTIGVMTLVIIALYFALFFGAAIVATVSAISGS